MKDEDIVESVKTVIHRLYKNDRYLIENDVNERAITHKIAEYLQAEFNDWHVDCEYNRDGNDVKKLIYKDGNGHKINPDVIVHKRGKKENLLVLEIKCEWNREDREGDKNKLKALTGKQYAYQLGIHLEITKEHKSVGFTRFKNGSTVN